MKLLISKTNRLLSICWILFVLIVSVLLFFIVYRAAWGLGDDMQLLKSTAVGKLMLYMHGDSGRFSPLALFDFNVLLLIPKGNTLIAHYLLMAVSYIVFISLSLLFYHRIISECINFKAPKELLLLLFGLFILLKVYPLFISIVFPERMLIILLTAFMISYIYWIKTNKFIYAILIIVSTLCSTYTKEPVSIALCVFGTVILLFNYKALTLQQKVLNLFLCINMIIFLLLYYFIGYRHADIIYYQQLDFSALPYIEIINRVFRSHKILFLFYGIFCIRAYYFIVKKERNQVYYDALLVSGITYSLILIYLKLHFSHYYFTVIVLCMPSLIINALKYYKLKTGIVLILSTCILIMFTYTYHYIKESQTERATFTACTSRLIDDIEKGYDVIWYNTAITTKSSVPTVNDAKKASLEYYINYSMKNNRHYQLLAGDGQNQSTNHFILLYAIENNNVAEIKNGFEALVHNNKLYLSDSFDGINVYKQTQP
ncbi:MAG: hypothetical protein H6Q17_1019 [Bacteroidetes bacterium]|nr:hypothetical protein [Bacteroidota bacterium]